jgi:hypothetical protein
MSELLAVVIMGSAADHNLYIVFGAAFHAFFDDSRAKIVEMWFFT